MDFNKIALIERRVAELRALILEGNSDAKWLTQMLHLNEKILTMLYMDQEIRFYQTHQEVVETKVFFCPEPKT